MTEDVPTGFAAMGHPIPNARRTAALAVVREMWPEASTERATGLVGAVADGLERDQPFDALEAARTGGLDVTGAYRLVATLLAGPTETTVVEDGAERNRDPDPDRDYWCGEYSTEDHDVYHERPDVRDAHRVSVEAVYAGPQYEWRCRDCHRRHGPFGSRRAAEDSGARHGAVVNAGLPQEARHP